jgi:hypothetical protein
MDTETIEILPTQANSGALGVNGDKGKLQKI